LLPCPSAKAAVVPKAGSSGKTRATARMMLRIRAFFMLFFLSDDSLLILE
jgi:hypothetical protein